MRKILVYGCGVFGQVVKNLVGCCGFEFAGFIDDCKKGSEVVGSYMVASSRYPASEYSVAIAVGYKDLGNRYGIYQKVKSDNYRVATLVHPQAMVDRSARIGEGVIVMAGAVVDYNAEIKDLVVLWNGVVVSHESVIGENTFLSPNCTVCGCSIVGRDCFIGAGAVVTDYKQVPDGSFVKAGNVNRWKQGLVK